MKTLAQIEKNLENFEKKFGLKVRGHEQLSETWFQTRLGVITASNAHRAVAKRDSDTRYTYMAELVAQICTGLTDEISAAALDWGRQHEDAARSYYEFETNKKTTALPFVFKDENYRIGCSPDGLIGLEKPYEIKCPWASSNYVKFLVSGEIKSEWKWQQQMILWVMGAEEGDFIQFDPRMKKSPMEIKITPKDADKWLVFEDLLPIFIEDMNAMLSKIGIKYGEQWARLAELPPAADSGK